MHREFPRQAAGWLDTIDRRQFLQFMGASLAPAGLGDLSQISISGLISENRLSNNQWLTSSKKLSDRNLRQIPAASARRR